jgi:hypothetical protein
MCLITAALAARFKLMQTRLGWLPTGNHCSDTVATNKLHVTYKMKGREEGDRVRKNVYPLSSQPITISQRRLRFQQPLSSKVEPQAHAADSTCYSARILPYHEGKVLHAQHLACTSLWNQEELSRNRLVTLLSCRLASAQRRINYHSVSLCSGRG